MSEGVGFTLAMAQMSDASEVLDILDEACRWLRSRGVRQWPERFELAWIKPALARGETWLASSDGRTVGTITVSWSDPAWEHDEADAGYVHRLAVRRSAAGLGTGLLDWAKTHCRRRGRRFLRLDCVAANGELRRYYEGLGFVHKGDVVVLGPPSERTQGEVRLPETTVSLYELDLLGG
jgi:GNAT superfamily N-acetyltransferase